MHKRYIVMRVYNNAVTYWDGDKWVPYRNQALAMRQDHARAVMLQYAGASLVEV
jgi:hypothetical protein